MADTQRAITGQSSFMRYATPGERSVARRLVKTLLDRGYVLSVNDGEEWTVKRSASAPTVCNALCTTGEDVIAFRTPGDERRAGSFCLIWGNDESGEELIADHTDNEVANEVYRAVMEDGEPRRRGATVDEDSAPRRRVQPDSGEAV
ncbi:hypothetical protein [Novosphingobium sp. FKTRR1]|uniref:hypothetical protein n=1 Tax=Novosphingobium sp. FKTRR1 TaxID=2879118 RepID=UPI001CF00C87|nr:hypothetical protein [Novosphingobium sp. FKTRR1]